jgi:hypothetical protein
MKGLTLLKDTHPELLKEWDFEKNIEYPWETISSHSGHKVSWKCADGHTWDARVYSRTSKRNPCGCRYCCHNSPPTTEHNLAILYPHLLEEWDYDKNKIDPHLVSPKSGSYHWKCRYGHTWHTRVAHRVNGSGCRKCKGKSSKQQLYLFCEVKHFFPNALYCHRINKIECDVYLPDEKIGIEFDSTRYHGDPERDARKVCRLREAGIEIISIREYKMPMVNGLTVGYSNNHSDLEITKGLMGLLGKMLERQDLTNYSNGNTPANEQEYLKELNCYPNNLDRTLANHNPKLSKEWDYSKNGGLSPSDFAPYSGHMADWICPNGHPYKAIISNRNLHKTGCAQCQNHSSLSYSRNKTREPIFPKRIRIRGKKNANNHLEL